MPDAPDLIEPVAPLDAPPSAYAEMGRRLEIEVPTLQNSPRDATLTPRYMRPPSDLISTPMTGHVVVAYYGGGYDTFVEFGKQRFGGRVRPGLITIIPERQCIRGILRGPTMVSNVYLSNDRVQSCADAVGGGNRVELLNRVAFDDPTTFRILDLLSQDTAMNDAASRLFVDQAIEILCTRLVGSHSGHSFIAPPTVRSGLAAWQVKRVTDYMASHLDQDIGLQELASLARLSRYHFCTTFRLATGRTPYQWLTDMRMDRAAQLLGDLSRPISEIALAVGYGTPSSFAARFRSARGMTPSEFRRPI